jgi:hypothetical protein
MFYLFFSKYMVQFDLLLGTLLGALVLVMMMNRGCFSNSILIDVGGTRDAFGISTLASGINLRADSLNYSGRSANEDYYQDSEGGDGVGNFRGFREPAKWELNIPDPRYLETRPGNWVDQCYNYSLTKLPDHPVELCNPNPKNAVRYLGSSKLFYNDDLTDSQFKKNQLVDKGAGRSIYVPWSMAYNRGE